MKILLGKIKNKTHPAIQRLSAPASKHGEKLSPKKKKVILFLFCALFTFCSTYIIVSAINTTSNKSLPITRFHAPLHIGKSFEQPTPVIPKDAYERVEHFKKYLDSISITDKKGFEQVLNARPKLMDSILMFEKLYLSQSKK